jgi:hypothetical protein
MARQVFEPNVYEILTGEEKVLAVDFANALDAGETISNPSAVIAPFGRTDLSVVGALEGAAAIVETTKVAQKVDGGALVVGRSYLLTLSAVGSTGQEHSDRILVRVIG